MVIRSWGKGDWEQLFNGYKVSFWGVCSSAQVAVIEYHRLSDLSHRNLINPDSGGWEV